MNDVTSTSFRYEATYDEAYKVVYNATPEELGKIFAEDLAILRAISHWAAELSTADGVDSSAADWYYNDASALLKKLRESINWAAKESKIPEAVLDGFMMKNDES